MGALEGQPGQRSDEEKYYVQSPQGQQLTSNPRGLMN